MKTTLCYAIISICCFISTACLFAQENEPVLYVQVDYMKVESENRNAYLDVELNEWKAIHEERVKAGDIVRWSVYQVRYPSGANQEYNYVTSTVYDDFAKINVRAISTARKALGKSDEEIEMMFKKTGNARSLVKRELWRYNGGIEPAEPAKFIYVNYMDVPTGQMRDFMDLRMNFWKPIHQATVDAGRSLGWGVYSLQLPGGSNLPYDTATVDIFKDFTDINNRMGRRILEAAHPGKSEEWWDEKWEKSEQTRDLVSRQLWEVIKIVDASTIAEGE